MNPLIHFIKQLIALLLLISMTGCAYKQAEEASNKTQQQTFQDAMGMDISIRKPTAAKPLRIMALSAALTEMLFATIPATEVVGVSHVCNYPADLVKDKPRVNTYPLDIEKLAQIGPELVLAEEGIVSVDAVAQLKRIGIPCYFFKYRTLADVWNAIDTIGKITGHVNEAKLLSDSLRKQEAAMRLAHQSTKPKLKVLGLVSNKPIYVWGRETLISDQLSVINAENAVSTAYQKAYPELSREAVLQFNPDVIFGGSFVELDSSFFGLYPELKTIKAYRNKACFSLDADKSTRPGPRSLEAVQEMSHHLNTVQQ